MGRFKAGIKFAGMGEEGNGNRLFMTEHVEGEREGTKIIAWKMSHFLVRKL